ncbi:MAG: hypothetical protein U5N55_11630 [Cypionkella sp.]|nr:hypothetical protein [Cypionkella sp.]
MELVRPAQPADIGRIVRMTMQLVKAVDGPQEVDPCHTGAQLLRLIQSPQAGVWVSDGGFIAGEVVQTIISPEPVAVEHGWIATDRSGLRLLMAFEAWAATMGCAKIKMSTAACHGVAGELLRRRGYKAAEMAWVK